MRDLTLLQDDIKYLSSVAMVESAPCPPTGSREVPPLADVIRFCRDIGLCITRTIALALKTLWQGSLTASLSPGESIGSFLAVHGEEARGHGIGKGGGFGFVGTMDDLYTAFTDSGILAASLYRGEGEFLELAGLLLERRLYLPPAASDELIEFAYSREGARSTLPGESGADAERYWVLHSAWREQEEEVATLLLRLETQTLRNRQIDQRWMETFGHLYVPLVELEGIYGEITALLEQVRTNPVLSAAEAERVARELGEIRAEAGRNRKGEPPSREKDGGGPGPGGIPWSAAEQDAYEEECKGLLRRIWQLTHPDRVDREGFTDNQKRRLVESYQEAMAWKDKTQLDEYEIGLARRSTAALRIILDRVERIWEEMGFDGDDAARVRGKGAEERIAWLEARIAVLDEEVREIRAQILAAGEDRDSREKEACLVTRERIEAVTAHMEERYQWYRDQIGLCEQEVAALLAAGREVTPDA